MPNQKAAVGLGISVPPQRLHVFVYFLQHGGTETEAENFFNAYNKAKWQNNSGKLITNWKVHAWQWIWTR